MNPYERLQALIHGQPDGSRLNFDILMSLLPRLVGRSQRDYYLDYRVLVQGNLAARDSLGIDILQAISDPYREAADAGLAVEFPENGLPLAKQPLLRAPEDLARLKYPAPAAGRRMADRLEAVRAMKAQARGDTPVMGWVEGALAEAANLRGVSQLMLDLADRPEWVTDLLDVIVETEIAFARAQIEAGADLIGLGDAVASQVSPRMYRKFALPYEQRIFQAVREMGAVPRLHICGDTTRILTDMAQSGAQILDLDWMVNLGRARTLLPEQILCGNLDPVAVMLQGTADEVYRATCDCLEVGGNLYINAAGCEIPVGTPPMNIFAQNRAIRDFSC